MWQYVGFVLYIFFDQSLVLALLMSGSSCAVADLHITKMMIDEIAENKFFESTMCTEQPEPKKLGQTLK